MSDSMNSASTSFFSDDEKAVAEILVDLPGLVSDCERRQFHKVYWKTKRKRSVLEDSYTTTTSSSPVSEKSKKKNVDTAAATSPCTTLAFPSSESDEYKQQTNKSNSKKRAILNKRSKHFKPSNTTNKELKAKKEELSFGHKTEKKPKLGMNGGSIEHYQYQISGNFNEACFLEDSSQPLDLNRLLMRFNAAEARRTRMMKIKEAKNQRRSQSQHLQCSLTYSFAFKID